MFNRKEYMEEYYVKNKEKLLRYYKQYQKDNQEKLNKYQRQYYKNNPEKMRGRTNNKKEKHNLWMNIQYKTNPKFNLNRKMSKAIRESLKGNKAGNHWEDLVNYTLNDLIERLKKTMPKSYTWQNFIEGKLHIDHKVPKSVFNYTKPEHIDFKRCWALENLQLLPAKENLIKKNKLVKPFQPALII